MSNQFKNPKLANNVAILSVVIILVAAVIFNFKKEISIAQNKASTTGKIIGLSHHSKAQYSIDYEYYVDGKKYIGSVGTENFDCNNKNDCVGFEIDVFYSSKKPQYSLADLRKYDKYRTTVYLIN